MESSLPYYAVLTIIFTICFLVLISLHPCIYYLHVCECMCTVEVRRILQLETKLGFYGSCGIARRALNSPTFLYFRHKSHQLLSFKMSPLLHGHLHCLLCSWMSRGFQASCNCFSRFTFAVASGHPRYSCYRLPSHRHVLVDDSHSHRGTFNYLKHLTSSTKN